MEVVIDLETADTKATAEIFSIGAVKFELGKLESNPSGTKSFYQELKDTQGRTRSTATMEWWGQQSPEARGCLTGITSLPHALTDLARFCEGHHVWGNGSIFDIGILENAYDQLNMSLPWRYSNVRCFRTVRKWYELHHPHHVPRFNFQGTPHNALDDAYQEAKYLNYYYLNP